MPAKKDNRKLEWFVYYNSWNENKIKPFNVFDHYGFVKACQKSLKKFKDDRETFLEEVKKDLMYYYWSKCEWEIILSSWPPRDSTPKEKIDVYDQVMLNWGHFCDYLWNNRDVLKKIKFE